jgi:hypothetical protein
VPDRPKYRTPQECVKAWLTEWTNFYERLETRKLIPQAPLEAKMSERYAREVLKIPPPPPETAYDFVRRWKAEFMKKTLGEEAKK